MLGPLDVLGRLHPTQCMWSKECLVCICCHVQLFLDSVQCVLSRIACNTEIIVVLTTKKCFLVFCWSWFAMCRLWSVPLRAYLSLVVLTFAAIYKPGNCGFNAGHKLDTTWSSYHAIKVVIFGVVVSTSASGPPVQGKHFVKDEWSYGHAVTFALLRSWQTSW